MLVSFILKNLNDKNGYGIVDIVQNITAKIVFAISAKILSREHTFDIVHLLIRMSLYTQKYIACIIIFQLCTRMAYNYLNNQEKIVRDKKKYILIKRRKIQKNSSENKKKKTGEKIHKNFTKMMTKMSRIIVRNRFKNDCII